MEAVGALDPALDVAGFVAAVGTLAGFADAAAFGGVVLGAVGLVALGAVDEAAAATGLFDVLEARV